jgi:hypothetical protein
MPVHDWKRVEAGIFHAFHTRWVGEIQGALNDGMLPDGFYALAEQHAIRSIADVLTLHGGAPTSESVPSPRSCGGTAVAEAPPKTRRHQTIENAGVLARRRTLAIRHVSGHRLIAMIEILSPGNKDREKHVEEFVAKAVSALAAGVHLLIVDLFPPGRHDPCGIHGVILELLDESAEAYDLPADEPLTLASYVADPTVDVYLEHLAPGAPLAEMPLFLDPDWYVDAPLEATYTAAYRGMPAYWRSVLEAEPSQSWSRQANLQPHLLHRQQRLGIAPGIVHRVVRVPGFAEVFEIHERVLLYSLIQRAQIRRAEAERVLAQEVVEVPVDELPVEAVIVRDEHHSAFAVRREPVVEILHHLVRLVKFLTLISGEPTHGECIGNELLGDRPQLAVEGAP